MKNIELKLRLDGSGTIISTLKKLGARYQGKLRQTDTYYNCGNGRLKIRETNNHNFELIFYQRPDIIGSKTSCYLVFSIEKPQLKTIKSILSGALGEKVVIKKQRDLWIYKNTRIHLDKVNHLGNFLELETLVKKTKAEAEREHNEIINLLNLSRFKKCKKSYSDMLLRLK